jgi:hypothetical protein
MLLDILPCPLRSLKGESYHQRTVGILADACSFVNGDTA